MGRPPKHDATTRDALLDAAEHLLATGGQEAVSVRGTAEAIDVSTRAVYSVCGSKQALMEGLAARGFGYLADLVETVPMSDDPLADLVAVGVTAFRGFAIRRPHLFRITFDGVRLDLFQQPAVSPELQRAFSALAARIQRALTAGQVDPELGLIEIAFMFHSLCHGLATNELNRMPPPVGVGFWRMTAGMDLNAVWTAALSAFVRGISTTPVVRRPS